MKSTQFPHMASQAKSPPMPFFCQGLGARHGMRIVCSKRSRAARKSGQVWTRATVQLFCSSWVVTFSSIFLSVFSQIPRHFLFLCQAGDKNNQELRLLDEYSAAQMKKLVRLILQKSKPIEFSLAFWILQVNWIQLAETTNLTMAMNWLPCSWTDPKIWDFAQKVCYSPQLRSVWLWVKGLSEWSLCAREEPRERNLPPANPVERCRGLHQAAVWTNSGQDGGQGAQRGWIYFFCALEKKYICVLVPRPSTPSQWYGPLRPPQPTTGGGGNHSIHTLGTPYIHSIYTPYTFYTDSIHLYTLTTSCSPFLTTYPHHWGEGGTKTIGGGGGGGRYWCIYILSWNKISERSDKYSFC